jgi:outer membrane immunogenic protein
VINSGVITFAHTTKDNIPIDYKLSESWVFRARGRVGYAMGSFLPFVAGGVSVTKATLDLSVSSPNFPHPGMTIYTVGASRTLPGFNIGAGVDWAVTQNIILRAEYIYDRYEYRNLANNNVSTVRLAAAFKF